MSVNTSQKFISDRRLQRSEEFPDICDGLSLEELAALLDSDDSLIHKTDIRTGWTLLFRAVCNGNFNVVELLLTKGADPNVQNIYGETPLHQAVDNGKHNIINLLLEKNADPNIQQQVI